MGNFTTTFNLSEATVCEPPENKLWLTISAVCIILIGLAFVFAGNKLIRGVAALMGFVIGFCVCFSLLDKYTALIIWWKVGIGAGVGLLLGHLQPHFLVLCGIIIKIAVAIMGFALGVFASSLILATPVGPTLFQAASWGPLVTILIAGVAMAIIALLFETYIMMIGCSLAGSFAIASAADCAWIKSHFIVLIPRIIAMDKFPSPTAENKLIYIMLGGIAVLAVVGFLFQTLMHCRSNRAERHQKHEYELV